MIRESEKTHTPDICISHHTHTHQEQTINMKQKQKQKPKKKKRFNHPVLYRDDHFKLNKQTNRIKNSIMMTIIISNSEKQNKTKTATTE